MFSRPNSPATTPGARRISGASTRNSLARRFSICADWSNLRRTTNRGPRRPDCWQSNRQRQQTPIFRQFLLSSASGKDFDALADLFRGNAEAQTIIAELKESAAIYQDWMSGRNYENNARRARLIASHFLNDYAAAADPNPKVVFKMGMDHVALGTTTNNIVDIGTLATSIAQTNGLGALRIGFLPTGGHNLDFVPQKGNPTQIAAYEAPEFEGVLHRGRHRPREPFQNGLDAHSARADPPVARHQGHRRAEAVFPLRPPGL